MQLWVDIYVDAELWSSGHVGINANLQVLPVMQLWVDIYVDAEFLEQRPCWHKCQPTGVSLNASNKIPKKHQQ